MEDETQYIAWPHNKGLYDHKTVKDLVKGKTKYCKTNKILLKQKKIMLTKIAGKHHLNMGIIG